MGTIAAILLPGCQSQFKEKYLDTMRSKSVKSVNMKFHAFSDLSPRSRCVVSFSVCRWCTWQNQWIGNWLSFRAVLDMAVKRKLQTFPSLILLNVECGLSNKLLVTALIELLSFISNILK